MLKLFLFFFRFLSQCTEYFDLRCQLLDDLTSESTAFLFVCFKNKAKFKT